MNIELIIKPSPLRRFRFDWELRANGRFFSGVEASPLAALHDINSSLKWMGERPIDLKELVESGDALIYQGNSRPITEEQPARAITDTERLDLIESQTNGWDWIARHSATGRGYRLHNTSPADRGLVAATAREAIDLAIRAHEDSLKTPGN